MRVILFLIIPLFTFMTTACSLFDRRASSRPNVDVYDVPVSARGTGGVIKKRVLVLPFLDEKLTRSDEIRDISRRAVVGELLKTGQLVVIKNSDFPQDFSKFMTEKNEYDLTAIAKVASGMGIAAVVEGKILEVRAKRIGDQVGLIRQISAQVESVIRIRMASGKTGKVILDDTRDSKVESTTTRIAKYSYSDKFLSQDPLLVKRSVIKTARGFIGQMIRAIDKVSWEGRVAMVNGEKVYVNAGRLSGLQVGDILKVTEEGPEIFDPESGRYIGNAPGRLKGTLEIISYFGKDGAIAVVHSGSGFLQNDRVELY